VILPPTFSLICDFIPVYYISANLAGFRKKKLVLFEIYFIIILTVLQHHFDKISKTFQHHFDSNEKIKKI
jgi:hypothetical protein